MGMLLGFFGVGYAQESSSQSEGSGKSANYAPAAGDLSGAILFGRGNFLDVSSITSAPYSNTSWTVPGTAPYLNTTETNSNSVNNMVGVELRYFLMDNIALKLSGGAIIRSTPDRANVPSVIDPNATNAAWLPAYNAVQRDKRQTSTSTSVVSITFLRSTADCSRTLG